MANNGSGYVIPFGIDGGPFFQELKNMGAGTEKFAQEAGEAGKVLTNGMKDAAQQGEKLIKTLDADTKELTKMKDVARQVGKDLGEALSGKNVGADLEARVKKFGDLMGKFSAQAEKPLKFNIDTAKLEHFEQLIASGADELKVLSEVIEFTKQEMAALDPQSEKFAELAQQVELAEGFLKELGNASDGVEKKGKTLVQQLRAMKQELSAMELAGKGNTQEFKALAIQAGELEDQIGDVSSRVRVLASDTKNIDAAVGAITALAGGFTAAQGAVALFGDENEAVNKIIQKVTGAMAVLQGVQAVAQALNKDSAISVLLFSRAQQSAAVSTAALTTAEVAETGATVTATTATEGLTAALLANPITAVLVAIAALVVGIIAFTSSSKDAKKATEDFNRALEENENLLNLDEAALKRRTDLQVAQAKRSGAAESEVLKIEGNSLIDRLALRESYLQKLRSQYNDENNRRSLEPAELKKLGSDIVKAEDEVANVRTEIQVKRLDVSKKIEDEQKERNKKAVEDEKKNVEDQKKQSEQRRQILEQQVKYTKELRDLMAEGVKDQFEKERIQARNRVQDQVETLNLEKGLSEKAIKERNKIITQLNKNLAEQLAEIDLKENAARATLQFQAQQTITDLQAEGLSKQINQLKEGFEDRRRQINEQYKNEAALRALLIEQVNKAEETAETKARNAGRLQAIKDNEENQILQVETAVKFLPNLPRVEEQKQIAILKVRLKYAELTLKALRDQGEDEKSTVVQSSIKQVQELQKALKGATDNFSKGGKKINFIDLVFGEQTPENSEAIKGALKTSYESIGQITDFIVDQYQRQIDKRQEVIDHYNATISDLEKNLEAEKQLRDEGLANNVDALQSEIDQKKAARDEEQKQQEELLKKQEAAQRIKLVLDTVVQATNLVTAASEIFAALAGIPFIGVPLAISTIGLMTGAFVAAKVKAFQLVSDGQKFGEGGYIDGEAHESGGRKYIAADGSGVVELEGGEFVANKRAVSKYSNLLEAINSDDISGMSDAALQGLLSGMGIHFGTEATKEGVSISRERDELRAVVVMPREDIKPEILSMEESLKFLAHRERNREERWQDENFNYTKRGNNITKTKR